MSLNDTKGSSSTLVTVIIVVVICVLLLWKFIFSDKSIDNKVELAEKHMVIDKPIESLPVSESANEVAENLLIKDSVDIKEPTQEEKTQEEEILKQESTTPLLNISDSWVKEKLSSIIWKKELIELFINEDMIRRFVVFVDNFSQGNIAYSHSPFIKPSESFSSKVITVNSNTDTQILELDELSFKRFLKYVDLLRAVDTNLLIDWYTELQPLLSEAYLELGYPDKKFEQVLQVSMKKVLDFEFPKERIELVRPSVMYQFKLEELESLDDADKLMLRIGKDNLLIIKSVLLEINEKLPKAS